MGLSATSARIFLLTKENNSYELAAQDVSEERMILAKEQEAIANEYSDATSNMVYQCRVVEDGETQQQTMSLESLAKSQYAGGQGNAVVIADANGNPLAACRAYAKDGLDDNKIMQYSVSVNGTMVDVNFNSATGKITGGMKDGKGKSVDDATVKKYEQMLQKLTTNAKDSVLQSGMENGSLQLWVQTEAPEQNPESLSQIVTTSNIVKKDGGGTEVKATNDFFTRKSPDSLNGTTSRYYTEDDAAAQAHYQAEMTRTSALDTKLENKLNHIETQKKACEKEIESAESVKSSNVDRTFSYFGK